MLYTRSFASVVALVLTAQTAFAQTDCTAQAALVMQAVEARAEGAPRETAAAPIEAALGADAAALLTDWIYSLPDDQLSPAIGAAWQEQCEAL